MELDESSRNDISSIRLDKEQARKLLSRFLALLKKGEGIIMIPRYFRMRGTQRRFDMTDVVNVLSAGKIYDDPEFDAKSGTYRYRIETEHMIVVILFRNGAKITCVTGWRK